MAKRNHTSSPLHLFLLFSHSVFFIPLTLHFYFYFNPRCNFNSAESIFFFALSLLSVFLSPWNSCLLSGPRLRVVECYLSHTHTKILEDEVVEVTSLESKIESMFQGGSLPLPLSLFFAAYENIATMMNPFCLLSLSHNSNLPGSCACYYVARWLIGWFSLNSNQSVSLLFSLCLAGSNFSLFLSFFSQLTSTFLSSLHFTGKCVPCASQWFWVTQ